MPNVCWFFTSKTCRNGDSCRFSHSVSEEGGATDTSSRKCDADWDKSPRTLTRPGPPGLWCSTARKRTLFASDEMPPSSVRPSSACAAPGSFGTSGFGRQPSKTPNRSSGASTSWDFNEEMNTVADLLSISSIDDASNQSLEMEF